jgi:hypothetical protein
VGSNAGEEEGLAGGLHLSVVRKKKKRKGKKTVRGGKWAAGLGMAQVGCCLPFPFFFDLKPFSFSVFYFIHRFCKTPSNQFKPLSEIF